MVFKFPIFNSHVKQANYMKKYFNLKDTNNNNNKNNVMQKEKKNLLNDGRNLKCCNSNSSYKNNNHFPVERFSFYQKHFSTCECYSCSQHFFFFQKKYQNLDWLSVCLSDWLCSCLSICFICTIPVKNDHYLSRLSVHSVGSVATFRFPFFFFSTILSFFNVLSCVLFFFVFCSSFFCKIFNAKSCQRNIRRNSLTSDQLSPCHPRC